MNLVALATLYSMREYWAILLVPPSPTPSPMKVPENAMYATGVAGGTVMTLDGVIAVRVVMVTGEVALGILNI